MRIGVDVDGVIYRWEPTARYLLRRQFGLELPESTDWHSIKNAITPAQWSWLWEHGVDNGLFRHGHLYTGAVDGVQLLSKLGDIVFITHRPRNAAVDTLDWLAFHRFPVTEVHILANERPKSSVQADVYIDDSGDVIDELVDNAWGALKLIWDRPWNVNRRRPPAMRVRSWEEAATLIGKRRR